MNNCNEKCNTCNKTCYSCCPICHVKGKSVNFETIKCLSNKSKYFSDKEKSYICINRRCDVIYFQENNPCLIKKEDVCVPIWFKSNYKNFIVCYCHKITLDQIVKIVSVSSEQNITKKYIFKTLNINEEDDCLHKNPLGESCDRLFANAIEFAYNQKNKGE